jgi:hypothetical protein
VEQAQARPNPTARFQAAVETLTRSPLKPVGAAQVRTGAVARGDAVVTVPVAHAITGRLKNQVRSKGLLAAGAAPLEIGQPVYGITTPYGGLYWCAPRQVEKDGRPQWTGVCLPDAGGATRWIPATPALFPTYTFGVSGNTSAADTPSVAPEPIDFGAPMTLEYRFAGWNKKYANIELHVRSAAGSGLVSYTYPSREADGSATLALMGGKVTISPAADGKGATVAVAEPLAAEGRLPF